MIIETALCLTPSNFINVQCCIILYFVIFCFIAYYYYYNYYCCCNLTCFAVYIIIIIIIIIIITDKITDKMAALGMCLCWPQANTVARATGPMHDVPDNNNN